MSKIKSRTTTPVGIDRPRSDSAEWPGSMADKVASDNAFVTALLRSDFMFAAKVGLAQASAAAG
jgi:hypothetical protein